MEPIEVQGEIQCHGFLVVIDQQYTIQFCSENIALFLPGAANDWISKPLQHLESKISGLPGPSPITALLQTEVSKNFDQYNPQVLSIDNLPYYLIITQTESYYLLEFEPVYSEDKLETYKLISNTLFEIVGHKELESMLQYTITKIKEIIDYERVMVYRFAKDGHAEVVAEVKDDELPSRLGINFPSADIPKNEKELYKLNPTRMNANVQLSPSKVLGQHKKQHPPKLAQAKLRAFSQNQIQYLKNMGVGSSFSISLLYKHELWGLIICHNTQPKPIDYKTRQSVRLIGQILSSTLQHEQDDKNHQQQELFNYHAKRIFNYLKNTDLIEEALTKRRSTLLNLANANGAVLVYDKKVTRVGITPTESQLSGLILWIQQNITHSLYQNTSISTVYPPAWFYKDIASGMLICTLSKEIKEYIIWFKPELTQNITWAVIPSIPQIPNPPSLWDPAPTGHSFELKTEKITAASADWSTEEIKSVLSLKDEIIYIINSRASALRTLNEKLTHAYDELDAFSYTISHDLKNPLAVIKSYTQLLERDKSLNERSKDFVVRITDRTDKMNTMINEVLSYSRIGRLDIDYKPIEVSELVQDIISDLRLLYQSPGMSISTGQIPDMYGDQTMVLQVFANLIGNAVKYSQHAQPATIHIEGEIKNGEICYRVRDNGLGIHEKDFPKLFVLFNRCESAQGIEGSGVGLAIVKRIVNKHGGRIWVESQLGKGSTFHLAFPQCTNTNQSDATNRY